MKYCLGHKLSILVILGSSQNACLAKLCLSLAVSQLLFSPPFHSQPYSYDELHGLMKGARHLMVDTQGVGDLQPAMATGMCGAPTEPPICQGLTV